MALLFSSLADQQILTSPCGRYRIRRAELHSIPSAAIVVPIDCWVNGNSAAPRGFEEQLFMLMGRLPLEAWLLKPEHIKKYPGGLPCGDAITVPKFRLTNCTQVIFTNMPFGQKANSQGRALQQQKLADCYRRCLEEALETGSKSITFPSFRRFNLHVGAQIGVDTVKKWFNHPLYGKDRREKIPGPIYFLSDPVGSYAQHEHAWWTAFQ